MKRLFLFIATCVVLGFSHYALSQEQDVTTKYLKNASFENKFTGWIQSGMQTQSNNSFTEKAGSIYVERWVDKGSKAGNAEVYQTLSKLPAGQYRLQAAAQNIQQDNNTKQTGAFIFAGTVKTQVNVPMKDYSVEFTTLGESIDVGFKATNATGNWLCVDNFKLYYVGADVAQMLEALQTLIKAAENTLSTANRYTPPLMQQSFMDALTAAIDAAKTLDESATAEQIENVAVTLDAANVAAQANNKSMSALKALCTKAAAYTRETKMMAEVYKQAVVSAYDAAQAILALESEADVNKAIETLQQAYDNAVLSNTAYVELNKSITSASNLPTEGKQGADALQEAIDAAIAVLKKADATPEEMAAATKAMDTALLIFRVENGSGSKISARTDAIVQGATELFGRATFGSGTTKEKGLVWSEDNSEPTIYDNRSTESFSNNGTIYSIKNLKPSTLYYVRAYTISNNWVVSYGDVVRIYTRPMGNVTFDYGYEGDEATNARIYAACEEAVWMWNNIGGIQHFHLSAHYRYGAGAGSGTAECSYGGYMSVSQNTGCQKTGTILHEGAHGLGMVPYTDWVNSTYRKDGDRGDWLGPRVDRVIQFLDNSATAKLHGDNQHMWPYGINGAGEDNGSPILYRANALLVEGLSEDGIVHSGQAFLTPGYSFTQDDEAKYYIKNSDEKRGLKTAYLVENTKNQLSWEEMTSDEAFQNDSCAWKITFNPKTCLYQFQNVGTGRWMTLSGSGSNSVRTSINASTNSRFQLLSARSETKFEKFTFNTRAYWIVIPGNSALALTANANGATGAANFDHTDGSTTQRWLLLTADEVARFGNSIGETVGVRNVELAQQGSLRVLGGQGVISITAVGHGADVSVYSLDGRLLRKMYVQQDANAVVRMPRGIYMVSNEKVMVR